MTPNLMNVTQICIGRFHHFHAARQFEKYGVLENIWTGYPKFKLQDELGISSLKIRSFPWIHLIYLLGLRMGLKNIPKMHNLLARWDHSMLDYVVSSTLKKKGILFALSGSGLISGRKMQKLGGYYICDRGSSHIRFQDEILREEHRRWGLPYHGIDPKVIDREEQEYQQADLITIPSEFSKKTFIQCGVDEKKLRKIPYGARLDRFHINGHPANTEFIVLWVGAVSIQKGFLDALHAFAKIKFSRKKFIVIGAIEQQMKVLLNRENLEKVEFKGMVSNMELITYYSKAHVFVLSSLQDGFGMVIGEALACGCPVIVSEHTGGPDLIENGKEGYIVPIRSPDIIADRMEQLFDPHLRDSMSNMALQRVKEIGGWDTYGNDLMAVISEFSSKL